MHSITLTLIMGVVIGQSAVADQSAQVSNVSVQEYTVTENGQPQSAEPVYTTQVCAPAVHETLGTKVRVAASAACDYMRDSVGPMPQSAYGPGYGCYPGANNRYMNRYPAFHGYYNANPNNFRHLYEYPWNATPVQPSPMYTQTVTDSQAIAAQASNDTIITPVKHKYRYNLRQPAQTVVVSSSAVQQDGGEPTPATQTVPAEVTPINEDLEAPTTLPIPQELPEAAPATQSSSVQHWQDDSVSMPKSIVNQNKSGAARQARLDQMYK